MTHRKDRRDRSAASLIVACCLFVVALMVSGCRGDAEPGALPSATRSPADTVSDGPTPSTEPSPSWEDKFTPQQQEAYRSALARFDVYEQLSEPIWRRGKATPAAEAFFREYTAIAPYFNKLLHSYESSDIQISGLGEVIASRPESVILGDGGDVVTIRQCVDYSDGYEVRQNGKVVEPGTDKPQRRTIELFRNKGQGQSPQWFISAYNAGKGKSPCSAA